MVVIATLMNIDGDPNRGIGNFEFSVPPRVGERVQVPQSWGIDVYEIVIVEHYPVELPRDAQLGERTPSIVIYGRGVN
jgi:hypothetical protein